MKQHTDAWKARIERVDAVALKTFVSMADRDSAGKLPQPPYVVIHPADGTDTSERYTGPKITQHPRGTLHIVGSSYDNASEVTALIKDQFIEYGKGVVLEVAGEVCRPMWWSAPLPVQVNDDLTPPLIYAVVELGMTTDPA